MTIKNGEVSNADEVISSIGNTTAQLAYEQVKSDATNWSNTDFLGADNFTDSDGTKNTVDTSNSTAYWSTDGYISVLIVDNNSLTTYNPQIVDTNPENFFDGDENTYAEQYQGNGGTHTAEVDKYLGKTWIGEKRIKYIDLYVWGESYAVSSTGNSTNVVIELYKYKNSTWSLVEELNSVSGGAGTISTEYNNVYELNDDVEGIAVRIHAWSYATWDNHDTGRWYKMDLYEQKSGTTVQTNTIINDIIPKSIVVYGKKDLPTNTDITVDVSEDGGNTFSITGKNLNNSIDTSTFTGKDLALRFNLSTTDTSVTPKLYGYGVAITDN